MNSVYGWMLVSEDSCLLGCLGNPFITEACSSTPVLVQHLKSQPVIYTEIMLIGVLVTVSGEST